MNGNPRDWEEMNLPDAIFECEECGMRGDLSDDFNYDCDYDDGWKPSYSCRNCGNNMSPEYVGLERNGVKKRRGDRDYAEKSE